MVSEKGGRWWEWRGVIRGHGRRVIRGIGSARLVSLADAREIARQWRRLAREGIDPKIERDRARRELLSFAEAAEKVWQAQVVPTARNAKHRAQWINTLRHYAFPVLGALPVHAITQADILRVLAPIWIGKPETARRVRQRLRTVMNWARAAGHFEGVNPVEGVELGLPPQRRRPRHFAALPWREVPALMARLEEVGGMGALALRFLILTAARSGEVRGARWEEIDTEAAVWTVPGERMKAGEPHRVPLSAEALAVLAEVRGLHPELVFPGPTGRPLSDMTVSPVLKRLGIAATVHGFRSSFRDWTEERTSFPHEVKEAALAHRVRDRVEAAYRRTDLFDKRRALMDAWGRFCAGREARIVRLEGKVDQQTA